MKAATLVAFLGTLSVVIAGIGIPMNIPLPTVQIPRELSNLINGTSVQLPDIMYFPGDNGEPVAAKIYGNATQRPVEESDVFFQLYTREGPTNGTTIIPGDAESLRASSFNASQPTYIITHGFVQSIQSDTIQGIKDMYIAYKEGNVIAVDWSKIAKNWLYFIVKLQTVQVGQFVAAFTAFLVKEGGVDISNVHLTGHSLGAHVVGVAGKNIHIILGKKAGRITGLDPAGPLYSVHDRHHRLDRSDADFVDVIHTCGGWLGLYPAIGHVDFYPNGGVMRQPGCSVDFVTAGLCSHRRSWEFFAESINTHRFSSKACSSYVEYLNDNCNDSPNVPMGQKTPSHTRGDYYLRTAKFKPYALG